MSKELIASARPGQHQVKIYKNKYVKTFVYARVRKMTFIENPSHKNFMSAIFRIAHNILKQTSIKYNP